MTWLTDDPTPIFIAGGFALVVLLVMLLKSGRGVILLAMAGVIVCMALAALADQMVLTDREAVAEVVYQAADAAERNDLEAVVKLVSPKAQFIRAMVRQWIGQVTLESVSIWGMDTSINRQANPPTAIARFNFLGQGKLRRGVTIHDKFAGRLVVNFRLEDGRWMVTDYQEE